MANERPVYAWSKRAKAAKLAADIKEKQPERSQTRTLYLSYECHETLRAHYSIFIPYLDDDAQVGKIIQVHGNPWVSGFVFEIKTGVNTRPSEALARQGAHFLKLGQVSSLDFVDDGEAYDSRNEPNPADRIECVAASIPLPYRKPEAVPEPADDAIWLGPHPDFERCQEWTRRFVRALVDARILEEEAVAIVQSAHSVRLCDKCRAGPTCNSI
ncbi:hypothetical protein B0H14DRAFT_1627662 [Mycena olivaceomarginata]|nr:hypothetical protein B0H14DRAFT_1627662 [Mycena olivaceomarginata]